MSGESEVSGEGRGSSPHGGRSKGCGGGGRVGGDDEGTGGFSSCGGGTGGGGGGCCPLEVVVSSRGLSSVGPRAEGGLTLASLQERFLLRRCCAATEAVPRTAAPWLQLLSVLACTKLRSISLKKKL